MKTISNGFKEALTSIKQIDTIITYADRDNTNYIITQNSEFLQTEAEDFLVTESAEVVVDNGGIQNVSIYWNTDIFKSVCKMLNLETNNQIAKGTELNIKVGLLVDGDYEYVDYGKFYTTEDSAYQLATGTYTTTAYDKMIRFNIKAIDNPLTFVEGTTYTLKQYLEMVCNKCGVSYSFDFTNVANATKQVIDGDPYKDNKDVTYRDIIDDIAECLGTNFIINADNKITNKELDLTSNITLDADILKDTNVYIGEKKNAIDGLQIYDGSTMINYVGDDNSIFKIKSNNIMSAHSQDLMENTLDMIEGFEYYAYQLETFGIFALEPFDCFTVEYNNTNYLLCSFHNDLKITSGVSEEIGYEFKDEDGTYEYTTSNSEDKTRDAFIEIDKAKGEVVLKATADGKLVEARLDADADDGSEFSVKADNINLEGYTTINGNFKIDTNGNMECNNGKFNGGKISLRGGTQAQPNFIINEGNYYNRLLSERIDIKGSGGTCSLQANGDPSISLGNTNEASGTYPYTMAGIDVKESGDGADFFIGTYINSSRNYGIYGSAYSDYTALIISNSSNSTVITPTTVTPGSLQESKKDFEKAENALDIVKKTDIYKYHYKSENDKDKKHYGFVIGKDFNYSKELTSLNGKGKEIGADLYSFVSVCCQAIKEQQEQIEELKQEVKELKNEK